MSNHIIVQKYGGATLATPEQIKAVALRISSLARSGTKVLVVVSAMGQTTNELIRLAEKVSTRPPLRELDMLLSVGERISMSLLSMALNDLGCSAISFTGSQSGILTDDLHFNANIIDVKAFRVQEALQENKVVIMAGFQGVSAATKEITTLGRGGSDITAVAIAAYLKADRCEILKDVDAVYSADPKLVQNAKPISRLNSRHFLEMTLGGAKVLNARSVELAIQKNVKLFIGSADEKNQKSSGTLIDHDAHAAKEQKIIALNSHAHVYQIFCHRFNFEELQNRLSLAQIGQLQLIKKNAPHYYITAPNETLKLLEKFESEQKDYQITDRLCSVCVTFEKPCQVAEINELFEKLIGSNIRPVDRFADSYSAYFILKTEELTRALQILHS